MLLNLGEISPVFESLLDGSFWSNTDAFSNDQLRSFLPFLISTSFNIEDPGVSSENLLSRLTVFSEGNRIVQLLDIDFCALEAEIDVKLEKTEFTNVDDVTKLKILVQYIREDSKDDQRGASIISDETIVDASLLLTMAYLHMPSMFPVEKTTLRMLSIPHGPALLTSMVMNSPDLLKPVISVLMGLQVSDECSKGRQKSSLLNQLFSLCVSVRWDTLQEMLNSKRDCLSAVRLACNHLTDEQFINFLLPAMLNKNSQLSQFVTRSSARNTLVILHDRLVRMIKSEKRHADSVQNGLLHSIAILQLQCMQKFLPDQMSSIISYMCRRDELSDAQLIVAISTLLAVPSFTMAPHQHPSMAQHNVDNRIIEWINWIKEETGTGGDKRESVAHAFNYVCVCLSGQRNEHLKTFLTNILKCKINFNNRHSMNLKGLFNKNCISEQEIAQRCASQSITLSLSSASTGILPIHSVYELLLTDTFSKHGVDISSWVENQISSAVLPYHSLLPEVVERFAVEAARRGEAGLSKAFVEDVFSGALLDESKLPLRVLTLLFLLAYRSQLDQMGSKADDAHGDDIYSRVPIRYLLSVVDYRDRDFECAKKSLVRLTTDLFPYMLPTLDSVLIARSERVGEFMTSTEKEEMENISKGKMEHFIRRLEIAPLSDQVRFLPCLVSAFMRCLDPSSPKPLVGSVVRLWSRLENLVPRTLYEKSSMVWLGGLPNNEIDLADLYDYPTALFRCDRRFFSSPPHFQCFVNVLSFLVSASRNKLMRSVHAANATVSKNITEADKTDRDALSVALDHTQGSLVIQLLVEIGDSRRMKDDETDPAAMVRRREIRKIAFDYIHQLFIQDKNVLKLTLFQTLPLHIVPAMVEGVPSMFVAIDFIQEMLTLPDIHRRIFAICLMVHIARKYRIANSCLATELILDVLHTLLRFADTAVNVQLFLRIIPTLSLLPTVFPRLAADVSQLLMRVSCLAKARMALKPLVSCLDSPEKELLGLVEKSLAEQVSMDLQ